MGNDFSQALIRLTLEKSVSIRKRAFIMVEQRKGKKVSRSKKTKKQRGGRLFACYEKGRGEGPHSLFIDM